MLEVEHLSAGYFGSTVLSDVSLRAESGITLVIGPNGAGKSTLVRSVTGTLRPVEGTVRWEGQEIGHLPAWEISHRGVATVPERARLFRELTVRENLRVGAHLAVQRGRAQREEEAVGPVLDIFPELRGRLREPAGRLSGGQQQMVSMARALAARPALLVMDEPTTGLYPAFVRQLLVSIERISRDLPILLTEQNVAETVPIAHRVFLLEAGRIVLSGTPSEIAANEAVRRSYLGEEPAVVPPGGS
jgi:branched-chain amino acid transport system ATP-binding protein